MENKVVEETKRQLDKWTFINIICIKISIIPIKCIHFLFMIRSPDNFMIFFDEIIVITIAIIVQITAKPPITNKKTGIRKIILI